MRFIEKYGKDTLIAVLLFLVAFAIRIYKVDQITPGMWADEITVSQAGESLVDSGKFTIYVSNNYGRPSPFLYFTGAVVNTFGRNLTAIRTPAIIFGALSIATFYFLLRLYFSQFVSSVSSFMLSFAYPLVVISRLGYDITASFFFQILTISALSLYYKKLELKYAALFAVFLAVGLYTYYNFRLFAIVAATLFGFIIYKKQKQIRTKDILVPTITFLILILPLTLFAIKTPQTFFARINSLWVFGQGLSTIEVVKEVGASIIRLSFVFAITGDPNPRQNPSGVPMFDLITTIVLIFGLVYLRRKRKDLFLGSLLFLIPPILSDVLSLERIPDYHYYGLGHPNTYRISGLIIIIYFWAAAGFENINEYFNERNKKVSIYFLCVICVLASYINFYNYFSQAKLNQYFYLYNYKYNGQEMLNVVNQINSSKAKDVAVSKTYLNDIRVTYFLKNGVKLSPFLPATVDDVFRATQKYDMVIVDPLENTDLTAEIINKNEATVNYFYLKTLKNPLGGIEALLLNRNYGL